MKRNVLKAGRSSLAVSIPKSFVEYNKIVTGQELDITCHGAVMIVNCGPPKHTHKVVDLKNLEPDVDSKVLDKILGTLFKQGVDTYELLFSNVELIEKTREIVHKGKLNMYEEPKISADNTIIIHSAIKQYDENTLEQMTAVIIKHIYLTLEEFVTLFKKGELTKKIIDEMVTRDKIINDHADICRRMINQTMLDYKSTAWYNFVDKCEKIGDILKYMIAWSYHHDDVIQKNLEIFDQITNCLYIIFSGSTNFSVKKMNTFFEACNSTAESIEGCKNITLYHSFKSMLTMIKDAYSDILMRVL